ncbi:MAG: type II toxin-antitoxin system VapC family toxin [Gammaproteobacteria bacterium]|nr:type II toxin-antitoxin system VapC family toxin [Gammaproteobacteria bacterium]
MTVLDASALLAFLFREPGHERVAAVVDRCCVSSVNLAEVLGRFVRDGHDPGAVRQRIRSSPIETVPFDDDQATLAAALLPRTISKGLSLGDRACLALAIMRQVPAMTADQVWLTLDLPVSIIQIRPEEPGRIA